MYTGLGVQICVLLSCTKSWWKTKTYLRYVQMQKWHLFRICAQRNNEVHQVTFEYNIEYCTLKWRYWRPLDRLINLPFLILICKAKAKDYVHHCQQNGCCFTLLHSDATQTAWHLPLLHGLVELGFFAWVHLSDWRASPPFLPQNTCRLCCPLPQGTEHCV